MRIAYLTQSYPPMISGAAIAVEQLARGMSERGHQTLVITASDRNQPYRVYRENSTIMRLRSIHNPMRVGQRVLPYPRRTVLRALREFLPDIIHAHDPLVSWIGYEYARGANIPIALTIHLLPWFLTALLPAAPNLRVVAESAGWMYVRWMARKFNSVITLTKTSADAVTKMTGVTATTIPCGINLQIFRPRLSSDLETGTRAELSLPARVPIILHVGRLDPEKNVGRILQAAAVAMRASNAHLLVAGDGREKAALIKLSQSLGMAERTHFPGYISVPEGLPEIYRMASLFVMASEIESQGIVLLEAAASGLPIAAVNATSTAEVVHDGINGYLVKPADIPALGEAITALLESPEKSRRMGRENRIVAENYDVHHSHTLHEQFYAELIKQKDDLPAATKGKLIRSRKRVKGLRGLNNN